MCYGLRSRIFRLFSWLDFECGVVYGRGDMLPSFGSLPNDNQFRLIFREHLLEIKERKKSDFSAQTTDTHSRPLRQFSPH